MGRDVIRVTFHLRDFVYVVPGRRLRAGEATYAEMDVFARLGSDPSCLEA